MNLIVFIAFYLIVRVIVRTINLPNDYSGAHSEELGTSEEWRIRPSPKYDQSDGPNASVCRCFVPFWGQKWGVYTGCCFYRDFNRSFGGVSLEESERLLLGLPNLKFGGIL